MVVKDLEPIKMLEINITECLSLSGTVVSALQGSETITDAPGSGKNVRAWQPEFNPQVPHDRRRKVTPNSWPLTSTRHTYTYIQYNKQIGFYRLFLKGCNSRRMWRRVTKGCHLGTAQLSHSFPKQLCLPMHDWALEIQLGLEEGLLGPSCSPSNWQLTATGEESLSTVV